MAPQIIRIINKFHQVSLYLPRDQIIDHPPVQFPDDTSCDRGRPEELVGNQIQRVAISQMLRMPPPYGWRLEAKQRQFEIDLRNPQPPQL